jgi:hypothetical protein
MARHSEHTEQQKRKLLDMLRTTLGVVETACQRVGLSRTTHYNWLKKDKKYAAEVADIEEVALDFGVTQLHKLMGGYTLPDSKVFLVDHTEFKGGKAVVTKKPLVVPIVKHHGPDSSAVIFFLKSKGKKRGYVERNELTGKDGAPVVTAAVSFTIEVLPSGPPLASSEKEVEGV